MSAKLIVRIVSVGTLGLLGGLLLRQGISADPQGRRPAEQPAAATETLGGSDRFLTHVATDKPVYRPGEKVYVRGVMLRADDRRPLADADRGGAGANVQIKGPKGDTVASGGAGVQESVLGFVWTVPAGTAGGEYTVQVTHPWTGQPPAERKFEIRAYRPPRLKSQIVFVRDGYGPGDMVAASLKVERAEGGVPADARVTVIARVDGEEVYRGQTPIDPLGTGFARFELPAEIERGEGTLAFVIEDGGVVETATKTIPILLQTVDLQMYPEGGDLIAGLPNRLYIEARTPAKKPADIAGTILDADGTAVAEFRTEHEGRGRVRFTPQPGTKYELKITEPAGISKTFPLPEVKSDGVVLSALSDVTGPNGPITVQVAGTKPQRLKVTLSRREVELASRHLIIEAGESAKVELDAGKSDGVLIATVWDESGKPLAERLVFRRPAGSINVEIVPDRERYLPGGQVALTIRTTDQRGNPVGAVVGLTVTDDSVLEMIEKREQAPRLPVMVLLESDVRELADAHVYLDPENPEAPQSLDLLLGTQGWRRFAFIETAKFIEQHGDPARRVLALRMPTARDFEARRAGRPLFFFERDAALRNRPEERVRAVPPPAPLAADAPVEEADALPLPAAAPVDQAALEPAPEDRPAEGRPAQEQAVRQQDLQRALDRAAEKQVNGVLLERESAARRRELALAGAPMPFVVVREYAHQVRPDREPGDRRDFTETLYWHAGLKTDAWTGEAKVSFGLSDAVTGFRVLADAFDSRGTLGTGTTLVESVEPFYAEPKLPLEVTSGDRIDLPLALVNATPEQLSATVGIEAAGLTLPEIAPFTLAADARVRRIASIDVGRFSGETDFVLSATAGPFADRVTRPLRVAPLGFPIEIAHGGLLNPDDRLTRELVVPEQVVPGSLSASVKVFPSPMASLTAALERLVREPSGCFEQSSSTIYPLVMAQQYFQSHAGVDPALIERSNDILARGHDRLLGFECKSGGFEWFGNDPGHEALTAYGLLQFTDMSQVYPVDAAMLDRTRTWLLGRRDGTGGFQRSQRTLHTWLPEPELSDTYITWALLSAGEKNLEREIAQVRSAADSTKNSYVLALAANVMLRAGDRPAAAILMERLTKLQDADGQVKGATKSIVGSGGDALAIETTSLATLAWLSDDNHFGHADKSIRWLAEQCQGGRFGSTQSTVLALKAIVAHARVTARPSSPGTLQLVVDGKPVGEPVPFDTATTGAIELPGLADLLTPGRHMVEVRMQGGSRMPVALAVNLHSPKPASSDECRLGIEVALRDKTIEEGAVTEARVTVTNKADETVPTPLAIIGIPGGLEVRHDQLRELVRSEQIAAYEVRGRDVVLYWRDLPAGAKLDLPLSLVAAIPGHYTAPASRAYLYYTDEHKQWAAPLTVEIQARTEE